MHHHLLSYLPIAMIAYILLQIKSTQTYFFVIGLITNIIINLFIKIIVRQPRPNVPVKYYGSHKDISWDMYGMPSGHAQTALYCFTYYFMLYPRNYTINILLIVTSAIILMQRYMISAHTPLQILCGMILGIIIGISFYYVYISSKQGNLKLNLIDKERYRLTSNP